MEMLLVTSGNCLLHMWWEQKVCAREEISKFAKEAVPPNCNANTTQPVRVTTGNICVIEGSPHHAAAAAGLGKPYLAEDNTGYLYKKLKFKQPASKLHVSVNNLTAGFCTPLQPLCPEEADTGLSFSKKGPSQPGAPLLGHRDLTSAHHLERGLMWNQAGTCLFSPLSVLRK